MPSGEANGLTTCHTRSRVRRHGKVFHGDIMEHAAVRCSCSDAVDVDARHARICPRAGAQVNQHQPLVHAMVNTLKRLGIQYQVKRAANGSP